MDNLEKLKEQILNELSLLSYLEKKKVKENLDNEYVEKELTAIAKQKKQVNIILGIMLTATILFTLFYVFILYLDPPEKTKTQPLIILLISIVNSVLFYIQKTKVEKRETLYKILSVFNSNKY